MKQEYRWQENKIIQKRRWDSKAMLYILGALNLFVSQVLIIMVMADLIQYH